ncbi:Dolichyl-diphosphooligosaccharide--protein glycosyltransferase subunit WBP1 [Gorgonomyces haynaldii]|nr:Dolichyl-diphosphooligosaccharide--protein glycosyltransferase subunit WBP1 [Gorgonomyces haynaldii]
MLGLVISLVACVLGIPHEGRRTLVVLNQEDAPNYSIFLDQLKTRGHQLTLGSKDLFTYEERVFDHVVVISKAESFGGVLKMGNLVDFVNKGGNVLIATSDLTEAVRDFAFEFSVDFETETVNDPINTLGDRVGSLTINDKAYYQVKEPVFFKGYSHKLSHKNELVRPILTGKPTSYAGKPITLKTTVGNNNVFVSAFQALNNARVVFCGSSDLFSDASLKLAFKEGGVLAGNKDFATDISKWVFGEKSVLKIESYKHHRQGEHQQHGIYRIKDDMVYTLNVKEYSTDRWIPYEAKDMMFEAVMLDPYVRKTMNATKGRFEALFRLPDHYGVFTFKVDYKRPGYSFIQQSDTVQVRPFRHDQYPRFLLVAYPYYVNIFSMMAAFFVFSALVLYNREPVDAQKKKQ